MTIKITNTLNQPLTLFYRIPGNEKTKSRLLEVYLPARALLHEVPFSSEEDFEAFKKQNVASIEAQRIYFGNINEKKVEKISNDNAAKDKKAVQSKKDKVVDAFEKTANSTNTKMKFSVQGGAE